MDRVLDLKPEVTQGCGFESRLRQEAGIPAGIHNYTLYNSVIILCIIVYVTNKAHPNLICNTFVLVLM